MNLDLIESKRYIAVSLVICVIFFIIVGSSFKIIPDNDKPGEKPENTYNYNYERNEYSYEQERNEQTETSGFRQQRNEVQKEQPITSETRMPELETISVTENETKPNADSIRIEQLIKEEKYESAVYEYQKMAEETSDNSIKAECYQNIALLYGKIKRYGTALSFAQKAYNTYPDTNKELLLARLYYKTGNREKAQERIDAILNRDFSTDK